MFGNRRITTAVENQVPRYAIECKLMAISLVITGAIREALAKNVDISQQRIASEDMRTLIMSLSADD